ncbi:MAG: Cdc6/Cdc18 family protein [Candidatus Bathyarchaeia archaeon]
MSGVLNEVFDHFLSVPSIFKDPEVLRQDYVPDRLPHRDEHIRNLGRILAPVLRGYRCSNVFVYGKPGTGKTAVTRFVLKELVRRVRDIDGEVNACYVNCRLVGTEYRILTNLSSSIGLNIPFTGLATDEVFERFTRALREKGPFLIVGLDEIDALVRARGDRLLYALTRIDSFQAGRLSLIGISNDLRFKENLDPRVISSLSEEELVFQPYTTTELRDILHDRASMALTEGALTRGAVNLCAALAAAEHGDARRALDLLRVAGELAEFEGVPRITEDHVRRAQMKIEKDQVSEVVSGLPLHSKLILASVFVLDKLKKNSTTGEIYGAYSRLCTHMGIDGLTQRRVSGLINELDVMGLLNARVTSMGRYGRTKKVRLAAPSVIKRSLFADSAIKGSLDQLLG